MGAIFGHTGEPDAVLMESMASSLRHRGGAGPVVQVSPWGSLGYLPAHQGTIWPGAGMASDRGTTVALAGQPLYDSVLSPEDLLSHYRGEGVAFLQRLQGAFVLALFDRERLLLARDGAGARTIYWGESGGRLLFAIEPKGIWQAPGFFRTLRPAAVAQYLSFSFVPGSGTMLERLHEVPAGHVLIYEKGKARLERFFTFEEVTEEECSEEEWVERFQSLFTKAVAARLPLEPVGVFLSGGLDSSVVVAELARHRMPFRTYALHFGEKYPNELSFARMVAERCRTEHEEVLITPRDFLPRLRKIIWHLDDPIGDPITVPNFELASHVSKEVQWVFNGEGGDPCFGGPKNIPMLMEHWYGKPLEKNFREKAYLTSYRRGYEDLERLLTPDFLRQIDLEQDLESILTPFFEAERPRRFLDKLAAINIRLKGAHLILPKVERMMGAWGMVPLSPLFDEAIIRFSFAMPSALRLSQGVEKGVLKQAFRDALPSEIIERPKSGMRVPVHFWFQKEMKRYAKKVLAPKELKRAGIFNPERVRQLLDYDIEEGPGRYGLRLWMLLTFEIWRRIVLEGESVG